jgi:ADP-ribosylglycohydrolase/catechol 2,3-dioxygenase-like lactoylglutathione lyase family enzyme
MNTPLPSSFPERVRGAFVSAAVGDALGWPQETRSNIVGGQKARDVPPVPRFRSWRRNSGTQFARYQETIEAGEYSDDTQLLLAVARACLTGRRWLTWLTRVELPVWTLYPRGAGRAVIAAGRSWADGRAPWVASTRANRRTDQVSAYFQAGANGVAMRIAPHAVITAGEDTATLLTRVIKDGITTHGHPRALVGAAVHALAIRHALLREGVLEYGDLIEMLLQELSWQNVDWLAEELPDDWRHIFEVTTAHSIENVWQATVGETRDLLRVAQRSLARAALANDEQTLEALGCYDRTRNGSGIVTAVAAAYVATRSAARPLTGLLRTAFLPKADTDTLASMTASLLGAIQGTEWLGPLSSSVQDADYLQAIGTQLANKLSESKQETEQQVLFDGLMTGPTQTEDISRFRDAAFSDYGVPRKFPDGRRIQGFERSKIEASGRTSVQRLRLRFEDGQTIILDKVTKSASPERRSRRNPETSAPLTIDYARPNGISQSVPSVVQVTLRVSDLERSLRFYRDILDLHIERMASESVSFTNGLSLAKVSKNGADNPVIGDARDVLVTIRVQDFPDVVGRVRSSDLAVIVRGDSANDQQLRLRDPDGHYIRILAGLSTGGSRG